MSDPATAWRFPLAACTKRSVSATSVAGRAVSTHGLPRWVPLATAADGVYPVVNEGLAS
jgi:hypothetical protein